MIRIVRHIRPGHQAHAAARRARPPGRRTQPGRRCLRHRFRGPPGAARRDGAPLPPVRQSWRHGGRLERPIRVRRTVPARRRSAPANRPTLPARGEWLEKRSGGAGGSHVQPATPGRAPRRGRYYQRHAGGRSVSALFLADGRRVAEPGAERTMGGPRARAAVSLWRGGATRGGAGRAGAAYDRGGGTAHLRQRLGRLMQRGFPAAEPTGSTCSRSIPAPARRWTSTAMRRLFRYACRGLPRAAARSRAASRRGASRGGDLCARLHRACRTVSLAGMDSGPATAR